MSATPDEPAALRAHFDRFVRRLVAGEKLALAPNATVEQLGAAFEGGVAGPDAKLMMDDAAALMEWLVGRSEVEELLVTDAEFARLLMQTHHAAPHVEGGERPAFVGMVVRACGLLVWIAAEAEAGRRFAALQVASPAIYAAAADTSEALDEDDQPNTAMASLDPLELGETGAEAVDPSESEMIRALACALEQAHDGEPLRALLARAHVALSVKRDEGTRLELALDAALDAAKLTRALGYRAR